MAQSVGAVALDIVMGKNTVSSVVGQAMQDVQKTMGDASATVGQKVSSVGKAVSSMGASVMPASAAMTALGGSCVKTAANFESSMSEVQAISGATGKDFDALRDKAQEMGAKTKFSASQSAEAMTYMAMAGWKTEDMLGGISGIMNLAAASGEDVATTSDIVTDALTAFGKSAKDSGELADIMAAASSNANTNVSMMGETFKYAAPIAGALGYTMQDTALATGLMANAGIKGTQAGTSLRSMFSRLASPPAECALAMEKLGISITNADGTMKPFRDVIGDLRTAINLLEVAYYGSKDKHVTLDVVNSINSKAVFFSDANEDGHYDVLSGLQKSIRGSDVDASLHYLARLITEGDLDSIYRRLSVIAYEDIGLANPSIGPKVMAAINAAELTGLPEARIPLGTIVVEMALSPKSNSAHIALDEALKDIENGNTGNLPEHIKTNSPLYKYPHDYPNGWVKQQYLPDNIKNKKYYKPKHNKIEDGLNKVNQDMKGGK